MSGSACLASGDATRRAGGGGAECRSACMSPCGWRHLSGLAFLQQAQQAQKPCPSRSIAAAFRVPAPHGNLLISSFPQHRCAFLLTTSFPVPPLRRWKAAPAAAAQTAQSWRRSAATGSRSLQRLEARAGAPAKFLYASCEQEVDHRQLARQPAASLREAHLP